MLEGGARIPAGAGSPKNHDTYGKQKQKQDLGSICTIAFTVTSSWHNHLRIEHRVEHCSLLGQREEKSSFTKLQF